MMPRATVEPRASDQDADQDDRNAPRRQKWDIALQVVHLEASSETIAYVQNWFREFADRE